MYTKKAFILLLLSFLSCCPSFAQLLWKVSGKNLKKPSYIFGTHHLTTISFLDSIPGIYKAFNQSDAVVSEMLMNSSEAIEKLQSAAKMPNNMSLKNLLSIEEFDLVNTEVKAVLKMNLNELSIMYPALVLNLYEIECFKQIYKLRDENLADSYFQLVAAQKNKKIIGLETIDQQISFLFQNASPSRQAELLVHAIKNNAQTKRNIVQATVLYKQQKLDELLELAKNDAEFTDNEFNKIIDNRNENWALDLPKFISSQSCFIAVGALHLPGKNGIIEKLRKAGYTVKPFK